MGLLSTALLLSTLQLPLSAAFSPANRTELKAAVNKWVENRTEALITYGGPIGQWDVSAVDDMSMMFCGRNNDDCGCGDLCKHFQAFDDDLSGWDVSKVTSMHDMFIWASSFNQKLSRWNTSSVTNMQGMFNRAISFDQDISSFNTASVTTMRGMFLGATSFNQDMTNFEISAETITMDIFTGACMMEAKN